MLDKLLVTFLTKSKKHKHPLKYVGANLFAPVLAACILFSNNAFASPEIQHWKTQNGAAVYFVPSNDLPMVDVRIVFDAGSARDTENKKALSANFKPKICKASQNLIRPFKIEDNLHLY